MQCISSIALQSKNKAIINLCALVFLSVSFQNVSADSQRIVDYEYDGAGNIISTTSNVLTAPPFIDVSSIKPNFINRGSSIRLTAIGTNLFKADITTDNPDLSIEISNTQLNQIDFIVTATEQAALGTANFSFTTRLGTDSIAIEVIPAFELQLLPVPALVGVGETTNFAIQFPQALSQQRDFEFSILDSNLATVAPLNSTISADENAAQISLDGLISGSTQLIVQSPLLVYEEFTVRVEETEPLSGDIYNISLPVSVVVGTLDGSNDDNPILSSPVSVVVGTFDGSNIDNPILSTPVSVIVPEFDGAEINPLLSVAVPVINGPILDVVSPNTHTRENTTTHTISGANLQDVSSVTLDPLVDITIDSFSVNAGGDEITVQITSTSGAITGDRKWIINTPAGEVTAVNNPRLNLTIQQ